MQGFLFLHILRGRSFTPRLLEEKKTKRPFNMQNRVVVASPPSSAAPLLIMAMQNIYQSFQRKKMPSHINVGQVFLNLFYLFMMFLQQSNYKLASFLLIDNKLPQRNFFLDGQIITPNIKESGSISIFQPSSQFGGFQSSYFH